MASADDPRLNGLLTTTLNTPFPTPRNRSNTVTNIFVDVRKSTYITKPVFRCSNGTIGMHAENFDTITVSKDYRGAFMMLGDYHGGPGHKLEVYAHDIDGVRQGGGFFLGAQGKTTWGFRWNKPSAESCQQGNVPLDWYSAQVMRLPMDDSAEHRAWAGVKTKGGLRVFMV